MFDLFACGCEIDGLLAVEEEEEEERKKLVEFDSDLTELLVGKELCPSISPDYPSSFPSQKGLDASMK
ncbi:hypothetical protein N7468_009220 [Penicillium chermesinum]|uniref:Uncharacterized protein n=1 Tax=Penicillium chermesinum TaxID=63820 RepID=A0A9W9NHP9_9EURO|nr:uncharacterized protein N7468_009220 [Penicillium chermesinum]KAJ5220016.1 hypothetical protein N7468_009220 [Penicillium chermesinum]KAJ6157472.1 hypothetical protein N7470_005064 [Penicillium chermesinum]